MKKVSLVLLFFSVYLFALESLKVDILSKKVANGRCFLLKSNEDGSKYVAFEGKKYYFFPTKNDISYKFYALVPVNYYAKPHISKIVAVVSKNGKKFYKTFRVKIIKGKYKSEVLKVASNKAKFTPKILKRIKKEAKEAKKIYNTITPFCYWQNYFILPLHSKITSAFGTRRVFNGILKSFHSGVDFRAKTGTPIIAANDGKVVLAKHRFLAGNSVIIDHGEGIYSCYFHLSKFKVKKGDIVKQGDVIGLAGSTGRVTGPHLHFGLRVWGVLSDPLELIKLLNQI